MPNWFEEWFNTEEYLHVYRYRNEEDAKNLFNLINSNIVLERDSKVLDLACGAGRHSLLFAKNGFDVTGVDISDNLLNVARKTANALALNINFIKSDLRKLHLSEKFHLIINLFTSFGYFESDDENEEIVKFASQHLFDNAYFVIDFFNIVYLKKNIIPVSYDKIEGGIIKQERVFEGNRIVKKITISKKNDENYYYESVRTYSRDELFSLIIKNGFKIQNIFGNYLGVEFEEVNSPRVIIIAKK